MQGLFEQRFRIERCERLSGTQMPLAIGKERKADIGYGAPQAHGAQHILQRPSRPRMHVHITRGDQR